MKPWDRFIERGLKPWIKRVVSMFYKVLSLWRCVCEATTDTHKSAVTWKTHQHRTSHPLEEPPLTAPSSTAQLRHFKEHTVPVLTVTQKQTHISDATVFSPTWFSKAVAANSHALERDLCQPSGVMSSVTATHPHNTHTTVTPEEEWWWWLWIQWCAARHGEIDFLHPSALSLWCRAS